MKYAILFFSLTSTSSYASRDVFCVSGTTEIRATVVSPTRLEHVTYTYGDMELRRSYGMDAMDGRADPWDLSPQLGTRFYFHSGNTSDFLVVADGVLGAFLKDASSFSLEEIFEQYERGGSQDITNFECRAE